MTGECTVELRRPGGRLLEAVRALAATFVLHTFVSHLAEGWTSSLAQGLLAIAAFYWLRPRPGWSLFFLTPYVLGVLLGPIVDCCKCYGDPPTAEQLRAEQVAETRNDLTFGLWLCFLAIVMIRSILGQGSEQKRRLRMAAGYLVPPLEPKIVPAEGEDVLLRPASRDESVLLRMARSIDDPSLLLHLEDEAAQAAPADPPPARVAVPIGCAPPGIDFLRLFTQVSVLGMIAGFGWAVVYLYGVEIPREKLFRAAMFGHAEYLSERLEQGVPADTTTQDGQTLLCLAAKSGSREAVRVLLAHGANVHHRDHASRTPLMHACVNPKVEVIGDLLGRGARIDNWDSGGVTPLMYAVRPGGVAVVEQLLDQGADVNDIDHNGEDALMRSASAGVPGIGRRLLAAGADARRRSKQKGTALMAASVCCASLIPDLLKHGADVHARTKDGETALLLACSALNASAVDTLLKAAARATAKTKAGIVPLIAACEYRFAGIEPRTRIIKALLAAGANPNSRDPSGVPALCHLAQSSEHAPDAMRALVKAGANVNGKDGEGKTPLIYAIQYYENTLALELLLALGANINQADADGMTPLMHSARCYEPNSPSVLLKWGADPFAKNKDGETALDIARATYGNDALERELERAMEKNRSVRWDYGTRCFVYGGGARVKR